MIFYGKKCPKCGLGKFDKVQYDTNMGNEWLEFTCSICGYTDTTNCIDRPGSKNGVPVTLESLNLPVRIWNVFDKANIETVTDILAFGADGLMELKGFGLTSLFEVERELRKSGNTLVNIEKEYPRINERLGDTFI